jgi:hypothetical protein
MHGGFSKRVNANPQGALEKYSNETPAQQAQHEKIAKRYRRPKGRSTRAPTLFAHLRMAELERLFFDRCGSNNLPDDDAGRDDLRLWLDHAAQLGIHYITGRARVLACWLTEGELDGEIKRAGRGKYWTADDLGKELNLTDAERTRLDIRTIAPVDRTKSQRMKRSKRRRATAEARRRANAGAKPHALSEARRKPWLALGISERTYHRRKCLVGSGGSDSCPILLESLSGTNHCHHERQPRLTRGAADGIDNAMLEGLVAVLKQSMLKSWSTTQRMRG